MKIAPIAVLLPLFAAAASPAFAQTKTKLEEGLTRTGVTVVKSVHALEPTVDASEGPGDATVSALALSNPRDAAWKPRGLSIAVNDASDRQDSISQAYVDLDEIDGLVTSLDWMLKAIADSEGKEDRPASEARFATKGGFATGFSFADGRSTGHARVGRSKILLNAEGLATLRGVIVMGRDHLRSLK